MSAIAKYYSRLILDSHFYNELAQCSEEVCNNVLYQLSYLLKSGAVNKPKECGEIARAQNLIMESESNAVNKDAFSEKALAEHGLGAKICQPEFTFTDDQLAKTLRLAQYILTLPPSSCTILTSEEKIESYRSHPNYLTDPVLLGSVSLYAGQNAYDLINQYYEYGSKLL